MVDKLDFYEKKDFNSVILLKVEIYNFLIIVEFFNGVVIGSGGEIRDCLVGGKGFLLFVGIVVYMIFYFCLEKNCLWEKVMKEREWLY